MESNRLMSRFGIVLIVLGLLIPLATFLGVRLWIETMPRVPPNQGAMVVAYFAHLAGLALGALGLGSGGVLLLVARLRSPAHGN